MDDESAPYLFREEPSWGRDRDKINPNWGAFDRLFAGVRRTLEWKPYEIGAPLGGPETGLRVIVSKYHLAPTIPLPPCYITLRIVRDPPDGLISLRRIYLESEVRESLLLENAG